MNPHNQKSLNLDLILRGNHRINMREIYEIEIESNYDSKMKSKAIQRKIRMKHDP